MRDCMSEKVLATWNPNRKQPNKFQRLQRKTVANGRTPIANVVRQFLTGLNPTMAPMVYATAPATLQAAIDTAKRYEAGFMMTQPKTSNYAEAEVTG